MSDEGPPPTPSASEVASIPLRETPSNLAQIAQSITALSPSKVNAVSLRGEQVFACDGVQMYFIKPNQNVATRPNTTTLKVVTIPLEDQDLVSENPKPPAFIEAGGWMYPLIPNRSPVYRSGEGYYLFPDLQSNWPGASIGLVLPSDVSEDQRQTFEAILLNLAELEAFPSVPSPEFGNAESVISAASVPVASGPNYIQRGSCKIESSPLGPTTPNLTNKIAVGIMAVAEVASRGISMGAIKTAQLLDKGAGYVKEQLAPASRPTVIDAEIKRTVGFVKEYSGKAVKLSGVLIDKLGQVTASLANYAAYYFQSTAAQAIIQYGGQSESDTTQYVNGFFEVAEGTVNGIGMVYSGLHHAAKTLACSITCNTVDVIGYCYGSEAGQITEVAAETVGNVALIGINANYMKPNKFLNRTAREAGRAIFIKANEPQELNIENLNPF